MCTRYPNIWEQKDLDSDVFASWAPWNYCTVHIIMFIMALKLVLNSQDISCVAGLRPFCLCSHTFQGESNVLYTTCGSPSSTPFFGFMVNWIVSEQLECPQIVGWWWSRPSSDIGENKHKQPDIKMRSKCRGLVPATPKLGTRWSHHDSTPPVEAHGHVGAFKHQL